MNPLDKQAAEALVRRRHHEYAAHVNTWRRLLDSLEGGETYRNATYGHESALSSAHRAYPIYNLKRHKRERANPRTTPTNEVATIGGIHHDTLKNLGRLAADKGLDPYATAGEDDFELRRSRTPVPGIVGDIVGTHADRLFAREVARDGPAPLKAFWEDVDGRGCSIDDFMQGEAGAVLLACGFVDLLFDRPAVPAGDSVVTRADELRLKLDRGSVQVILPQNMLWWRLDALGRYAECLVRECYDDQDGEEDERFRHWDKDGWSLYDPDGNLLDSGDYRYGRPPITRTFDRRKLGCRNVGHSAYESAADRMREIYNLHSEQVISSTNSAFAMLMGPEEYLQPDQTIPVGPGYLLPKKKVTSGSAVAYEGFEYLSPPTNTDDSRRSDIAMHMIAAYDAAGLEAPAWARGVARESGIALEIGNEPLDKMLAKRAKALARCERAIVEGWALVTGNDPGTYEVNYPSSFGSHDPEKRIGLVDGFQKLYEQVGRIPEVDKAVLKEIVKGMLPGLQDVQYEPFHGAIDDFVDEKVKLWKMAMAVQQPGGVQPLSRDARKNTPEGMAQPERHSAQGITQMLAAP
jgi:hypothetical protein